jgi:GNAT superfamily N-acetyltransferase
MVFGVYRGSEQVGFARVVSDRATFAWIGDVFIVDAYRGQGLGKWLMECIVTHPELQGLRRWMLATRDAHGLYAQSGFTELHDATRFMERWDRDIYKRARIGTEALGRSGKHDTARSVDAILEAEWKLPRDS